MPSWTVPSTSRDLCIRLFLKSHIRNWLVLALVFSERHNREIFSGYLERIKGMFLIPRWVFLEDEIPTAALQTCRIDSLLILRRDIHEDHARRGGGVRKSVLSPLEPLCELLDRALLISQVFEFLYPPYA